MSSPSALPASRQIERLRQILEAVMDERVRAEALADLEILRATLEVQGARLLASHETWPRDERGDFATQEYVDALLKRPRLPEPHEVHWILEAWGVAPEHYRGLTAGYGTRLIQEAWDCLLALMPYGQAASWMGMPNDNPLFQGQPPVNKLLEGRVGLAAIHHLLMARMNNW